MPRKKLNKPTHEEAVRRGRMGGKKTAENRRKRKAIKDYLEVALQQPPHDPSEIAIMDNFNIDESDRTEAMTIVLSVIDKAKTGDMRAVEFIRDTIGEKPDINLNAKADISKSESKVIVTLPDNGRGDLYQPKD